MLGSRRAELFTFPLNFSGPTSRVQLLVLWPEPSGAAIVKPLNKFFRNSIVLLRITLVDDFGFARWEESGGAG